VFCNSGNKEIFLIESRNFSKNDMFFFVAVVFIVLVFLYQNNVLDNTLPHDVLIHYSHPPWGLLVRKSNLLFLFLRSDNSGLLAAEQ
jgi:hypothetical protein